ncbi:hypothetical protein O9993_22030 [Vibrio lentus]|nr:hypothetical protein [Vibrio lentus]
MKHMNYLHLYFRLVTSMMTFNVNAATEVDASQFANGKANIDSFYCGVSWRQRTTVMAPLQLHCG